MNGGQPPAGGVLTERLLDTKFWTYSDKATNESIGVCGYSKNCHYKKYEAHIG
jgi:hypothetical protein